MRCSFPGNDGRLTIATTHTQARYALPQVVRRFKRAYPKVHLVLHQASPAEIVALLQSGEADIGTATEALDGGNAASNFASFPFCDWHHLVVVPDSHAPTKLPRLTLKALTAAVVKSALDAE